MRPPPDNRAGAEKPAVHAARDERHRELVRSFVGKKVSVSTTDFHHLVGRLVELLPDDRLRFFVNNQEVLVRRQGVARIHQADPALAEYIK
jgi:hypothetical protein